VVVQCRPVRPVELLPPRHRGHPAPTILTFRESKEWCAWLAPSEVVLQKPCIAGKMHGRIPEGRAEGVWVGSRGGGGLGGVGSSAVDSGFGRKEEEERERVVAGVGSVRYPRSAGPGASASGCSGGGVQAVCRHRLDSVGILVRTCGTAAAAASQIADRNPLVNRRMRGV